MKLIVNTDGGARGNPGPAASAFVVKDEAGRVIAKKAFYLGDATNNVAEYTAVIKALEYLKEHNESATEIEFYLDSNLVVQQLNRKFKIKSEPLKLLADEILSLSSQLSTTSFSYVPRENNHEADKLVNECLDNVAV